MATKIPRHGHSKTQKRFLAKTQRTRANIRKLGSGCLEWRGARNLRRYGTSSLDGTRWLAHRLAYVWWIGRIPKNREIHHNCENTSCIEPSHLEAVTPRENKRRAMRNHFHARKTQCPLGHAYTPYVIPASRKRVRRCLPCGAEWVRRARKRQRTAA